MRRPPPPRSLAWLVTVALVSGDLPDVTGDELSAAADHVDQSIAGMPDAMRVGVRAVSLASGMALLVLGGRPFGRQPVARQRELLARLASLPLPGVAEFVRLTRGLGLVSVFEGRSVAGAGAAGPSAAAGAGSRAAAGLRR